MSKGHGVTPRWVKRKKKGIIDVEVLVAAGIAIAIFLLLVVRVLVERMV